ncbi:OmpA family protein [Lysobacter capsici]|uniref:OmpA family protein n=1 Tax=Lysobacter capsici TaxID=435897 RepID=UPI001C004998|nr:OmpA family protein [Lysobacter capsici]QWF18186.1 OmpA family protein [Lysobacter capsici]
MSHAVPSRLLTLAVLVAALCACGRDGGASASADPSGAASAPAATADTASANATTPTANAAPLTAGDREFPVIPTIVVPDILGVTPAQRALESSMQDLINPIEGVTIKPARCGDGGALINDAGLTHLDAQGNLSRNDGKGTFNLSADGSGSANYQGGLITVNADGSGSINTGGDEDDEDEGEKAVISVNADGSGSYTGRGDTIHLDGKGGGSWNGEMGLITYNGDGSGSWNGPQGLITINADGSGTWNGPDGLVRNDGKGRGTVGTPPREMAMAPIPKLAPAGRFPLLNKFVVPGAPCGVLITLNDKVLFDFDKSDIRPDAAQVLDTLAEALAKIEAKGMQIRGHTDAKGSDDYNLSLSDRRAQSVVAALRQRGAAKDADARGFGESQPVAPNEVDGRDNPSGRQLNRRVEIYVKT